MKKTVMLTAGGLMLAASGAAFAQTAPAPTTPRPAPGVQMGVQIQANEPIAAEKIIGRKVVNAQNQTIGDVNSVVLGADGKVDAVVVGVGGFLGIGEREVALRWNDMIIDGDKITSKFTKDQLTGLPEYKYSDPKYRGTVFSNGTQMAAVSNGGLVSSSKIVGLDIRNDRDETVGKVKDVVIGDGGKVQMIVAVGERNVLVDADKLKVARNDKNQLQLRVAMTGDQLRGMPEYHVQNDTWVIIRR